MITYDALWDPNLLGSDGRPLIECERGVSGPSDAPDHLLAALNRGEGVTFKMYDDDNIHYYTGKIVADGDVRDYANRPLIDFGTPNAGAVFIRYPHHPEWNE